METVTNYFELSPAQIEQFTALPALYRGWNEKINLISRKDTENLEVHHILHSLAIAKVESFAAGSRILDVGTGGGFPGIPLAILFPEVEFMLVDSIGKKINVVNAIATELGLTNVQALNKRAKDVEGKFDFVISRAVARLSLFWPWIADKINSKSLGTIPNGVLYLKGGDVNEELNEFGKKVTIYPISGFFAEAYFETKLILHIPKKF